ncbi:hypothetical protein DNTS_014286 [Danionella cerebrum]|uniref:UDENN domain-containing protein n=1 Tax=Danionella cerebrum TaxID=2873325 RepID=A0A553R431_9TELE|nr:hypothetical protein DNTS_014286 [Danionella translucida]
MRGNGGVLTACVHGSTAMLFPMHWQHIFIPVLPPHLLDYCCAPMPYLIGVHLSLLERVKSRSLEDVVILNVDTNTLESPSDDLHNLPSDVVSSLKNKLKKQSTATGAGVARAFLHAQAALFGSYRDALRYKPGEPITFCEKSFVSHRSSTMRNFLAMAVNLQLFKQFIEGRLAKLNAGRGFTDVYEEEITEGGFCGSSSKSYQQWIHTKMRERAKPVVKNFQMAKDHAKRKIRDMKDKITQKDAEEEESQYCEGSPTSTKSLSPRRLQRGTISEVCGCLLGVSHSLWGMSLHIHTYTRSLLDESSRWIPYSRGQFRKKYQNLKLSPKSLYLPHNHSNDDTTSRISLEDSGEVVSFNEDSDAPDLDFVSGVSEAGQMNLLEEILDSLSTSHVEQGKLSSAKSLDFFRSFEELDYNPKKTCKSPPGISPSPSGSEVENGEPGSWNMGQDDSAIYGKHLPPSPRRQTSSCSLPAHNHNLGSEELANIPLRNSIPQIPSIQIRPPSIIDTTSNSDSKRPVARSLSRQKVLLRNSQRPQKEAKAAARQPSVLVPWENEKLPRETGEEDVANESQEKGLLEEIESICRISRGSLEESCD